MTTQKTYINIALVYLLLFTSGSYFYEHSSSKYLLLAFAASLMVWLISDRSISNRFVVYVAGFSSFLILIHFYTGGSLEFSSVIGTTLKLVTAYLIVKTVGDRFIGTYINVVVFLAAISLLGYLSDQLYLFDGLIKALPKIKGIDGAGPSYEGIFYLFRFQEHLERNNSIFYEPGAYQIFLNAALFMLFFVKTNISRNRQWLYILILTLVLATTRSTTGYLIFLVMLVFVLTKSKILSGSGKAILASSILLAAAGLSAQFQKVIFEKIQDYFDVADITDQSNLRSFDVLVDLEIIKRHIFGVGYTEYLRQISTIGKVKEGQTSSNGVTLAFAVYGLPFSLFLFTSYYLAFRRLLGPGILSFVAFVMLLIVLVGESYYLMVPYTLAIIAGAFVCNRKTEESALANRAGLNRA
ncbi:MAG TPA: hypothetical protein ENI62_00385 [Gammaproteobacteria bacterium]|nr:hypothetical protein [Gammaproteobacteria bacterium]